MLETARSLRGMVVAPHRLAAQAGLRVLQDGGNAVEAMVAAASAVAVVYPHMNGLGGDCFWLIHDGGDGPPVAIDACGAAAAAADIGFYRSRGLAAIPSRGPLAALTVAGRRRAPAAMNVHNFFMRLLGSGCGSEPFPGPFFNTKAQSGQEE